MDGWICGKQEGNTIFCHLRRVLGVQAWMAGPEKKLSEGGGECGHELEGKEEGPKRVLGLLAWEGEGPSLGVNMAYAAPADGPWLSWVGLGRVLGAPPYLPSSELFTFYMLVLKLGEEACDAI